MEAMIHDNTKKRRTFTQHCRKGYVLGTSTEHYRCWNLWNTSTKSLRVSGTVFVKHKYTTNPPITPEDAVIYAANRMTDALKMHHLHNMGEDNIQALHCLEQIFKQAADNTKELGIKTTPPIPTPRVDAPQQSTTQSK